MRLRDLGSWDPLLRSFNLEITARDQAEADRKTVEGAVMHLPSAIVAVDFARGTSGDISLMDTIAVLREKAKAVNAGDLADAETLLMDQALALNTIFGELSRRAAINMGQYLEAADKYMRLALKAQGQCRATLETLATIKNPPLVFAKQANIANGPQQVNNGTDRVARAKDSLTEPSKLLEDRHAKRLDTGTSQAPGGGDPALAAVGRIDGT